MSRERYRKARFITLIGAASNVLQGIVKLVGGVLFNSDALIADGLHSFSDLLTDAMVVFASRFGSQAADEAHPYGHQRIETATTLLLSLILIVVGMGIGWHAFEEWSRHALDTPTLPALVIAVLSILLNEILFFTTLHVGKTIHSNLVKANAWHHRSDSASSIVVALGIIGSLLGHPYLDALAAMIVALLIIKMGVDYSWNSVKELIDTAVEPKAVQSIERAITKVSGVNKVHQLRTRSMGGSILVDVHILVSPFLSVSEGHYIAQHVHRVLLKKFPLIKDVTVHVDPEDDEYVQPSLHLPHRKAIEKKWLRPLQKAYPEIQSWVLHYLDGRLNIDLILETKHKTFDRLQDHCEQLVKKNPDIREIRLFTELPHLISRFPTGKTPVIRKR